MNETETNSPAQNSDLEFQVAALQRQVFLLLLALIVVTATVVFYLYYQSRIFNYDLNQYRPQAMQIIQTYEREESAINNVTQQVVAYGKRDPQFSAMVLRKYGLAPQTAPAAAPSTAPMQ